MIDSKENYKFDLGVKGLIKTPVCIMADLSQFFKLKAINTIL